ncbi:hypothetical protein BLNAU_2351 [Blattamonas nauphoetae]|uniref:Uncharacterized protein n=1 Tax=Blattamonas nauphoetae TaxID=2049346 RepID=A0ABQ9YFH0_9EUKA|nr:hypothetical protein BLNAU_2351 [Blattamonas nauphoetae]
MNQGDALIEWANALPFVTSRAQSTSDLLNGELFSQILSSLTPSLTDNVEDTSQNSTTNSISLSTNLHKNLEDALVDPNHIDAIRSAMYLQIAHDLLLAPLNESTSFFLLELLLALGCTSEKTGEACGDVFNDICVGEFGEDKRMYFVGIIEKFFPQPQSSGNDSMLIDETTYPECPINTPNARQTMGIQTPLNSSVLSPSRTPMHSSSKKSAHRSPHSFVQGYGQSSIDPGDSLLRNTIELESKIARLEADLQNLSEEKERIGREYNTLNGKHLSLEDDFRVMSEEKERLSNANTQLLLQVSGGDGLLSEDSAKSFLEKQREEERKSDKQALLRARERADELTKMLVEAEGIAREKESTAALLTKTLAATQAQLEKVRAEKEELERGADEGGMENGEDDDGTRRRGRGGLRGVDDEVERGKQTSDTLKLAERIQNLQKQLKEEKTQRDEAELLCAEMRGQLELFQSRVEHAEEAMRTHSKDRIESETKVLETVAMNNELNETVERQRAELGMLTEERDKLKETCELLQAQVGGVMERIMMDENEDEEGAERAKMNEKKRQFEAMVEEIRVTRTKTNETKQRLDEERAAFERERDAVQTELAELRQNQLRLESLLRQKEEEEKQQLAMNHLLFANTQQSGRGPSQTGGGSSMTKDEDDLFPETVERADGVAQTDESLYATLSSRAFTNTSKMLHQQLEDKEKLVQQMKTVSGHVGDENALMQCAFFHLGRELMQASFRSQLPLGQQTTIAQPASQDPQPLPISSLMSMHQIQQSAFGPKNKATVPIRPPLSEQSITERVKNSDPSPLTASLQFNYQKRPEQPLVPSQKKIGFVFPNLGAAQPPPPHQFPPVSSPSSISFPSYQSTGPGLTQDPQVIAKAKQGQKYPKPKTRQNVNSFHS